MQQEEIADEVKYYVATVLSTITDMVEEAIEPLSVVVIISAKEEIHAFLYNAVEHVVLDQMKMAVLEETI